MAKVISDKYSPPTCDSNSLHEQLAQEEQMLREIARTIISFEYEDEFAQYRVLNLSDSDGEPVLQHVDTVYSHTLSDERISELTTEDIKEKL